MGQSQWGRWGSKRGWDKQIASQQARSILGWIILAFFSYALLGVNLFLLIVYPTVGTLHSIVGVALGSIMVVGTTANLMGKIYEDR